MVKICSRVYTLNYINLLPALFENYGFKLFLEQNYALAGGKIPLEVFFERHAKLASPGYKPSINKKELQKLARILQRYNEDGLVMVIKTMNKEIV